MKNINYWIKSIWFECVARFLANPTVHYDSWEGGVFESLEEGKGIVARINHPHISSLLSFMKMCIEVEPWMGTCDCQGYTKGALLLLFLYPENVGLTVMNLDLLTQAAVFKRQIEKELRPVHLWFDLIPFSICSRPVHQKDWHPKTKSFITWACHHRRWVIGHSHFVRVSSHTSRLEFCTQLLVD